MEVKRVQVGYWVNGLGEECSSEIHAKFTREGVNYVVVWDRREAIRSHGLIVIPRADFHLVRMETQR